LYILFSSLLLIGYAAQGASIDLETSTFASDSGEYVVVPALPQQLDRVFISEEGYEALYAATGFFLVAKGLRILTLLLYALALPRFRSAHLIQALFTLLPCLIFLRMFFVSEVVDAMEVFAIGVGLDIFGKFTIGVVVHMISTKDNSHQVFIPALEIGHVIEKTTAFFVLVAGEILMAVAYVAKDQAQIGTHAEYGRSCLGVIMAFLLCWVYFDADSSKIFVHAIRCVQPPMMIKILTLDLGDIGSRLSFGRSSTFRCARAWSLLPQLCTKRSSTTRLTRAYDGTLPSGCQSS
jgi:hypothetical protein